MNRWFSTVISAVLLGLLALPSAGIAEQPSEWSRVPEGPIIISHDGPGSIIVDARAGNSIVPLHDTVLTFKDRGEYDAFISELVNTETIADETTKSTAQLASITVLGSPMTLDSSLSAVVPTSNPIATLVGGKTGTIQIGGTEYCIDGTRCHNPVGLFSLKPIMQVIESSLDESPLHVQTNSAPAPFRIAGDSYVISHGDPDGWGERRFYAATSQVSGSFGWMIPTLEQSGLYCWEDSGQLQWPANREGLECFWLPQHVSSWVKGSNELLVALHLTARKYNDDGVCEHFTPYQKVRVEQNLYGISHELIVIPTLFTQETFHGLIKYMYWPSTVFSHHHGYDFVYEQPDHLRPKRVEGFQQECP